MVNFSDDDKEKSPQMGDNANSAFGEPKQNTNWQKSCGILCRTCNKIYTKQYSYFRHYKEKHPGCKVIFTCTLCRKDFEDYNKFRNHCYRHVIGGRYKCNICNKGFSQQSQLSSHVNITHGNPLSCKICNKVYHSVSNLNRHIGSCHNGNIQHSCNECGKTLQSATGLRMHMLKHKVGQYLMCATCGKKFTQQANLKIHMESHVNSNPYLCEFCPRTFTNKSKLESHLVAHSNDRQFLCQICNKSYKTRRYLSDHHKLHTEAATLFCKVCNKGFFNSLKLKDHMNVHTGEKPYACKYCTRLFANYPNWLKHVRRVHKVDHKTGKPLTSVGLVNASVKKPHDEYPLPNDTFNNNDVGKTGNLIEDVSLDDLDLNTMCVDLGLIDQNESLHNLISTYSCGSEDDKEHTGADHCSPLDVGKSELDGSVYRNAYSDGETYDGQDLLESSVAEELIELELAMSDNYEKDPIDSFDIAPDMPDVNVPSLINSLDDDLLYSNEAKASERGFQPPLMLSMSTAARSEAPSTPPIPTADLIGLTLLSSDLPPKNNLRDYIKSFIPSLVDHSTVDGNFAISHVDSANAASAGSTSTTVLPNCFFDTLGNIYYVK
ncbi:uncharacterized protein LOC143912842 [Arctopsyche grandis]|uniref:uncharacterized protein LOC143912842 n=1 Tax=Arctopsyche grandis TaxID=121162 RepID=UPI00406DA02E